MAGMMTAIVTYTVAIVLNAPSPGWIAGGIGVAVAIGYTFSGLPQTNRQL